MSTIVMAACWPLQMSPIQKGVLIALADQANDQGVCWPAVETIAERTCASERAVQEALKWLEEHGAISRERRTQRSTMYTVTPAHFTGKASKPCHYVYRIEHTPTGRFYIGMRSCLCPPEDDNYWGSGASSVWIQKNKADCTRSVLAILPTRREAAEYEALETEAAIRNPLCMNRRVAAGDGGRQAANSLGAPAAPANGAPANPAPAPGAPANGAQVGAADAPLGAPSAPLRVRHLRFEGAPDAPEPSLNRKGNHQGTANEPFPPAAPPAPGDVGAGKAGPGADPETALQAACRRTWHAYSEAYTARYGVAPVRNAAVNANVKALVKRLGHTEAPLVAAWYVEQVNEAFVAKNTHGFGPLVAQAESYRTQWARGAAVTSTAARQADRTAANRSAIDEACRLVEQRAAANAQDGGAHA